MRPSQWMVPALILVALCSTAVAQSSSQPCELDYTLFPQQGDLGVHCFGTCPNDSNGNSVTCTMEVDLVPFDENGVGPYFKVWCRCGSNPASGPCGSSVAHLDGFDASVIIGGACVPTTCTLTCAPSPLVFGPVCRCQ